jgi:hypothetical protein
MYEGYLEFGDVEIINSARSIGYTTTSACNVGWLVGQPCDGVADVLEEQKAYVYDNISDAPWYDEQDAASHRFFGVHGVRYEGLPGSTRTATVQEGVLDGGVVGRVRHATRRVRVEAMLTAQGEDALESGLAWLDASLRPPRCSEHHSHGEGCAPHSDVRVFTACPPSREQVTKVETVWGETDTNLATNPSYASSTGTATLLRTNIAPNPSFETNTTNWTATTSTLTRSTEWAYQGTASAKLVNTTGSTTAGDLRVSGGSATSIPLGLVVGDTFTISAYCNTPAAHTTASSTAASRQRRVVLFYSTDGATYTEAFGPQAANEAGVFRVSHTFTIPAGTTGMLIGIGVAGSSTDPGFVTYVDSVLVEKDTYLGEYFDGGTAHSGMTEAWTGTAHGSTSTQSAPDVADVATTSGMTRWRDYVDPLSGSSIMRVRLTATGALAIPTVNILPPTGYDYTLVGYVRPMHRTMTLTPRIRGAVGSPFVAPQGVWTAFKLTTAAGSGSLAQTGILIPSSGAGGQQIGDIIDFDAALLATGTYEGNYFDGDGIDVEDPPEEYAWTGTAHASTSTHRRGTISDVPDEDAFQAIRKSLTRYMHTVTAISGPTVVEKFNRGDAWGYLVEFVLASAVPWLHGVTEQVVTVATIPEVVQDVPFNLVPHPSVELASGTVITATNLATNPSAELNITGWGTYVDNTKILSAQVVAAVSTETKAIGVQSARSLFTANTTDVTGAFGIQQTVILTGITANMRFSVNCWAFASVASGTAVLGNIEIHAFWQNSSGVTQRGDAIGTMSANGGAVSAASILPPATTDRVLVRALVRVTSWSTGAQIKLFADALAVTSP